ETVQLSVLEETEVVYIAKKESSSKVKIHTYPGMKMPAHSVAMGKVMLSSFTNEELEKRFSGDLKKVTKYTVDNSKDLIKQVRTINQTGYIVENQETVENYICIAAPVYNEEKYIIAAVSFTMTTESWEDKCDICKREIIELSKNLSIL